MAAGACPACPYAAVDDVLDRRVGAELEECFDRRTIPTRLSNQDHPVAEPSSLVSDLPRLKSSPRKTIDRP